MPSIDSTNQSSGAGKNVLLSRGAGARDIYIYSHSDIIYWWVVWAYGFVCGALSYFLGAPFDIAGEKAVLFYPEPWLGISFVFLLLYVILFTNVQAHGVWAWLTAVVLALIFVVVYAFFGWGWLLKRFPLLFVHMNAGFYILFSTILFAIWLFVTILVDRVVAYRFQAGQLVEEHRVGTNTAYDTFGMQVRALPYDIFRHNILGLWWLGLGMGDLMVRTAGAARQEIVIRNVWRVGAKSRRIQALLASRRD